jgi:AbrB family looped-hinge helix DNA binding protein
MAEVTVSSRNQIVIPREVREALQLKPGDKLLITAQGGKILVLEKPKSYSKAIRGVVPRGYYGKDYLRKERQSWK